MTMIFKDQLSLLGLKSTDSRIVDYLTPLGLKVPKWRNANQGSIAVKDKATGLNYKFSFDIINDAFYPPVSHKNDNYRFEVYLSSIYFELDSKKKGQPQLPPDFWDGFLPLDANEDNYRKYFEGKVRFQIPNFPDAGLYAKKSIDQLRDYEVFYSLKENRISAIQAGITEDIEHIGHIQLASPNNYFNPQSYLLVVKWLFDQKRLLLPDSVYDQGLDLQDQALEDFTKTRLMNHLWDSQLEPMAPHFFYNLTTNVDYETNSGAKTNIYLKRLFLIAAGVWDKYHQFDQQSEFEKMDELYLSTSLSDDQKIEFLKSLESTYQDFTKNYREKNLFT